MTLSAGFEIAWRPRLDGHLLSPLFLVFFSFFNPSQDSQTPLLLLPHLSVCTLAPISTHFYTLALLESTLHKTHSLYRMPFYHRTIFRYPLPPLPSRHLFLFLLNSLELYELI